MSWGIFRKIKTTPVESRVAILYATSFTLIAGTAMELTTFVFRLSHLPFTAGFINDYYLAGYLVTVTWVIYSFEKVYRSAASRTGQLFIAVIFSFFAVYASDIIFYLQYRYIPPHA